MKKMTAVLLLISLLLLGGCASASPQEPAATATPMPTATPEPTSVTDMPFRLERDGTVYEGVYTGKMKKGLPDGSGEFRGRDAARRTFAWDGGWSGGEPSGEGSLLWEAFVTGVNGLQVLGTYEGGALSAVPNGEGRFAFVTDQGVNARYDGAWADGMMDGEGRLSYDAQGYYTRLGTFTAGVWTPTWIQALETIGTWEPCFTLTDAQIAFLEAHPELWEQESHQNYLESAYRKEYSRELTLRNCFADPALLDDPAWMGLNALRTVRSYVVELDGAPEMTCVFAADSTYSYPVKVILPDRVDGLRRGQRFHVYAMPIGFGEYTTVLGEKQTCLVMVAGDAYFGQN